MEEGLTNAKMLEALPPIGVNGDTLFAHLLWNIWTSRNKLIFEKRCLGPAEVCTQAIAEAREWTMAQYEGREEELIIEKQRTDKLKRGDESDDYDTRIFTDAAWNPHTKRAGAGWKMEDMRDGREATGYATTENVRSALMAEALACLEALKQVRVINRNKVKVSSDSLNLIRALSKREYPVEVFGILSDIVTIARDFAMVMYSYVPRKENTVADGLAKMALNLLPDDVPARGGLVM